LQILLIINIFILYCTLQYKKEIKYKAGKS
jgi:hypothetical protein